MIDGFTARFMGIKFLRGQKCFRLAGAIEQWDSCLDDTFTKAIRTLGKKRVAELYKKLPKQLKIYLLWALIPSNDERFEAKFMNIYIKYQHLHNRLCRDRCKDFKDYYQEAEEALLKYFGVK